MRRPFAVPHLDEAELGDVARDGRLDGVDPLGAQRLGELRLGREVPLLDEAEDRALALESRRHPSVSRSRSTPRSASSTEIVSGGVIRSAVSPAVPTSRLCSSAACATGPAGRPSSTASRRPAPRTFVELRLEPLADRAHVREQVVVDRLDDGARGGAGDGVAAEGRGVVARDEPGRGAVGDEQRADREAVREPLGERDRVGADAGPLPGEELARAADPGLHLVEDEQRVVARRRARAPPRASRARGV